MILSREAVIGDGLHPQWPEWLIDAFHSPPDPEVGDHRGMKRTSSTTFSRPFAGLVGVSLPIFSREVASISCCLTCPAKVSPSPLDSPKCRSHPWNHCSSQPSCRGGDGRRDDQLCGSFDCAKAEFSPSLGSWQSSPVPSPSIQGWGLG